MTVKVLTSGKVGALPAYLGYFFLRFPGALGPEESWDLECLDTYDRRWSRQGQFWIRQGDTVTLIEPPSLFPIAQDFETSFKLHKPQTLGRITVKVRSVKFLEVPGLEGQLVKLRENSYLVLRFDSGDNGNSLLSSLTADGLEPLERTALPDFVQDRGSRFVGPTAWPLPNLADSGRLFLLEPLSDWLRVARQYEKGIRNDVDTECLHQYRVQLRRVRSLASLGRMWEGLPEWNRLKIVLRTLQQKTNELRDLDVLLLDLPGFEAALPWDEGPKLAGWASSIRKQRQGEQRRVRRWLEAEEHSDLWTELEQLLGELAVLGESWSVGDLASSAFQKSSRSLQRCLKNLGRQPADEALHEVRIQAKRLRYVLESLGNLAPAPIVKELVATLKETQDGLGRFQDRSLLLERLQVERSAIRKSQNRVGSGLQIDPLAFGILVGLLVGEQSRRKTEALADSRQLRSKAFLKALDRLAISGGSSRGP